MFLFKINGSLKSASDFNMQSWALKFSWLENAWSRPLLGGLRVVRRSNFFDPTLPNPPNDRSNPT